MDTKQLVQVTDLRCLGMVLNALIINVLITSGDGKSWSKVNFIQKNGKGMVIN